MANTDFGDCKNEKSIDVFVRANTQSCLSASQW